MENSSTRLIRFELGRVVATPAALAALANANESAARLLTRHLTGDFGDVDKGDWQANNEAIAEGGRVFSSYLLGDRTKVWVITEADRSATTLLLPDEY